MSGGALRQQADSATEESITVERRAAAQRAAREKYLQDQIEIFWKKEVELQKEKNFLKKYVEKSTDSELNLRNSERSQRVLHNASPGNEASR